MKKFLFATLAATSVIWMSLPGCSKSSPATVNHYDTVTVRDTTVLVDTPYSHINDSLWAWFALNNGSLVDSSGNNHTLTLTNGVTWGADVFGNPNGCLQFPGSSAYASIADGINFQSQNFTISLFAMYSSSLNGYLFGKQDYSSSEGATFNIGIDPVYEAGTLRAAFASNQSSICGAVSTGNYYVRDSSFGLQVGYWYHIVVTFSNGNAAVFVDGDQVNGYPQLIQGGTQSYQALPFTSLTYCSIAPFILGNWWQSDNGPAFSGKLDDIRIYNRVLADSEITYLYKTYYSY